MKLSDLRKLTDESYKLAVDIAKWNDLAVVSNMPYTYDAIADMHKRLDQINEIIQKYNIIFNVPVLDFLEDLNKSMQENGLNYLVAYKFLEEKLSEDFIGDLSFKPVKEYHYGAILKQGSKDLGKLFDKIYIDNNSALLDRSLNNSINLLDGGLIMSDKQFKCPIEDEVAKIIYSPEFQNVLWNVVAENVRRKKAEKIKFQDTNIEIIQNEINAKQKRLDELKELKKSLEKSIINSNDPEL